MLLAQVTFAQGPLSEAGVDIGLLKVYLKLKWSITEKLNFIVLKIYSRIRSLWSRESLFCARPVGIA